MGKRGFSGHSRGRGPQSKRRRLNGSNLSRKDQKSFKELGELHPADDRDSVQRYARVEEQTEQLESSSSSAEESEEETVVQQLYKSLGVNLDAQEDESEEGDDEEDEEEDEDDDSDNSEKDTTAEEEEEPREVAAGTVPKTEESSEKEEEKEEEDLEEEEEDVEEVEHQLKEDDPFSIHFERDVPEEHLTTKAWKNKEFKVKSVGEASFLWKKSSLVPKAVSGEQDLKKMGVKHKLAGQVKDTNIKECGADLKKTGDVLTPFQYSLFSTINNYQDLLYPRQSPENSEEIRLAYCLHAVNHVLKTRSRVIAHNTKLKARVKDTDSEEVEYRDQGLTRPKVLVVVPTRHGAHRVVSLIISLLSSSDQEMVSKRKRFQAEYGPEGHDDDNKGLKPDDYNAVFSGNIDEHFRIGVSVSKKSLRLYSPFYMADIIIASPLGLRTVIGAPGDKDRDYDFLSSIEILILDQTDFFLMQNWDHVTHMFDHLHLQPRESHNMDFTRTRMWALNGWSKYYRQTLVFSSLLTPEIANICNTYCHNYCGKVQVHPKSTPGSVCQVFVQLPQMFHRIECESPAALPDARFQFFLKEVLPQHKEKDMKQTLIYIPDYFDFVRIRNYFKRETMSFAHINEYASSKGIRRARIEFKRRKSHFMLYTERVHFYRRFKLRGLKHIIFYALPQYPHFYSEMCNMLAEPGRASLDMLTCTVLYSRFEGLKLAGVVGTSRAERMIESEKTVHMLVSGDTS